MLRRFLYLDEAALAAYLSPLEGGRATDLKFTTKAVGGLSGGVNARLVRLEGAKSTEGAEETSYADTPEAMYDRLEKSLREKSEELGFQEVVQPDVDLEGLSIGSFVSWECEVFVPDIIKTMSSKGEVLDALRMLNDIRPVAEEMGLDTEGLPDGKQANAFAGLITGLNVAMLVVGEDDDSEWSVSGKVEPTNIRAELEGRARIVGKVSSYLSRGQSQQFLTFPGLNMLPRAQRRSMKNATVKPGEEDQHLMGPAVLLDILAIYR